MNNDKKIKTKLRTKDIELDESVEFSDMNLSKEIQLGLKQTGFIKPSPIQLKAIPLGKLGLGNFVH
jgi:ATP-dependent RNA helicase DDX20